MPPTAEQWLDAFAAALGRPAPSAREIEAVLALASVAAHASERIAAPVACWLAAAECANAAARFPELRAETLDGRALAAAEPGLAPGLAACRLHTGRPLQPATVVRAFAARAGGDGRTGRGGCFARRPSARSRAVTSRCGARSASRRGPRRSPASRCAT